MFSTVGTGRATPADGPEGRRRQCGHRANGAVQGRQAWIERHAAPRGARPAVRTADQQDRNIGSARTTIVFENCRAPEENVFAQGNGDLIVAKDFTRRARWRPSPRSRPLSLRIRPQVRRPYTVGSDKPIIHYQAVGCLPMSP
jgi:hypothetical protein